MFDFEAPNFLLLLPLAALPPLLHLLNRRRPPLVQLPTTRFLLHAPQPQEGRRKLHDIALMVVRTVFIAMLILALAAPRWTPPLRETGAGQPESALVILLDSSASMRPRLEAARAAVAEALSAHPGWEVMLFAFDREVRPLPPGELSTWQPGYAEGAPGAALKSAAQWLSARPRGSILKLLIISDLQQTNWNQSLPALPPGTQLVLHPLSAPSTAQNAALASVQTLPLSADRLRVKVCWRNFSDLPQERIIRITAGQHQTALPVQLPAQSTGSTALVVEASPDAPRGRATLLPNDGFPDDDELHFWARREPPTPLLLLLSDTPEDSSLATELEFFLERALTAERAGLPGRFAVEKLGIGALPLVSLNSFALVVLGGCAERLNAEDLAQIREFQASGGSLVVIPGNAPVAAWRNLQQAGLVDTGEHGISRAATGLAEVPEKTLLAKLFPPSSSSDLQLFSIRQLLRLGNSVTNTVLLRTLDHHPALVRHILPPGGPIYAFAFPFQLATTDFVLTQSFLPILREICVEATHGHSEIIRLHCGEPLPAITAFDGTALKPELLTDTARPGLALLGSHPVEINLPPAESSPTAADAAEIIRALQSQVTVPDDEAPHGDRSTGKTGRDLRKWCLATLAMLAMAELLLALPAAPAKRESERHFLDILWR